MSACYLCKQNKYCAESIQFSPLLEYELKQDKRVLAISNSRKLSLFCIWIVAWSVCIPQCNITCPSGVWDHHKCYDILILFLGNLEYHPMKKPKDKSIVIIWVL